MYSIIIWEIDKKGLKKRCVLIEEVKNICEVNMIGKEIEKVKTMLEKSAKPGWRGRSPAERGGGGADQ